MSCWGWVFGAVTFVLAPPAVHAGEWNGTDYAALFADKAQLVEKITSPDGSVAEILRLKGDIFVQRTADGNVTGIDRGTSGAVGCFLIAMRDVTRISDQCPKVLSEEEKRRLESLTRHSLLFFAQNAYPPTDYESASRWFANEIAARGKLPAEACEIAGRDSIESQFIHQLVSAEAEVSLAKMLEVPRLPVNNPCL